MKNGRYGSFAEVAEALGCKVESDVSENLEKRQRAFRSKYKCKACGELMEWVSGTSIMACKNPNCKGLVIKKKDDEGNNVTIRRPSYKTLNARGTEIASEIFAEV